MKKLNHFLRGVVAFTAGVSAMSTFVTHSGSWKVALPVMVAALIGMLCIYIRKRKLPTDQEVADWYDRNISNDSASTAIYKFRVWLKERRQ